MTFLYCCALTWIEFSERSRQRAEARVAWNLLETRGININFGTDGFNVLSFRHPESITDEDIQAFVPALLKSPFEIGAVDLKGTEVTDLGVRSLSTTLPECEVLR